MNRRYLLLVMALAVVGLWLSGLLSATCVAAGRSVSSCDNLTSAVVGLFVGGLVSFWASAQVAAASDRETRARLTTLTDDLEAAIDAKLNESTSTLTTKIDAKLDSATATLTDAVDEKLKTVSRDLTTQMQKDLQAVADGISTGLPPKTASAIEARQMASAAVAALPLIVKALPHLIRLIPTLPVAEPKPPGTLDDSAPHVPPAG